MTMDKDDLARVLCRVVGLYFVLTAIIGIGQLVLVLVTPMLGSANVQYEFSNLI